LAWARLTTKTQTSAGNSITTDTFTASKFFQILFNDTRSAVDQNAYQFNSDTGSNYALRSSENGGESTLGPRTSMLTQRGGDDNNAFDVIYGVNLSSEEKLLISFNIEQNTAGAGNAPNRTEVVNKWANTSSQITTVKVFLLNGSNYNADSNITIIGSDGTPSVATWQNGLEFHETDTNKDYVWNSSTNAWIQIT